MPPGNCQKLPMSFDVVGIKRSVGQLSKCPGCDSRLWQLCVNASNIIKPSTADMCHTDQEKKIQNKNLERLKQTPVVFASNKLN
jgi:hypothetical protein